MGQVLARLTVAVFLFYAMTPGVAAQAPGQANPDDAQRDTSRQSRATTRGSYVRLARAPNMFGDSLNPFGQITFGRPPNPNNPGLPPDGQTAVLDVPLGGNSPTKISENSSTLPTDRIFFNYNGYQNAVQFTPNLGLPPDRTSFNQYTLGAEKTFLDGNASLDVRVPLQDRLEFNTPDLQAAGGNLGNVTLYLKGLLYAEEDFAFGGGLGIGLPTGDDFQAQSLTGGFLIENEAVHLLPYLGFLRSLNEDWFVQSFVQFDFAANGNPVTLFPQQPGNSGIYSEQHLMHLDLTVGRWLYQNPDAAYLSRIAGVIELHYTSTLQDADSLVLGDPAVFQLTNAANRSDILNLTGGLQFQFGEMSNLRVACVVPVREFPDRLFTSEVQVSFNRYF